MGSLVGSAITLAPILCGLVVVLVYKFELGAALFRESLPRIFLASLIFAACQIVTAVVLGWIFMMFTYAGAIAAIGGSQSAGNLISIGAVLQFLLSSAVTYGFLVLLKIMLKVEFRTPWMPIVGVALLAGAETVVVVMTTMKM